MGLEKTGLQSDPRYYRRDLPSIAKLSELDALSKHRILANLRFFGQQRVAVARAVAEIKKKITLNLVSAAGVSYSLTFAVKVWRPETLSALSTEQGAG